VNNQAPAKSREKLRIVLMNIFPFLLIIMLIDELSSAIKSPGAYPFGSSINSAASIYASQGRYIAFHIVEICMLMAFISLSFFRHQLRRAFIVVIVLNILLFLYPILTARS
jgi:hypothetical protein